MRRSMLFLPGNTPNMIINGDALGADCIILDLEDAVSPDEKDSARLLVRSAMKNMGFRGVEITVRINSIDTEYWRDDLEAIIPLKPDFIMPPKSGCAEDIKKIDAYITGIEEKCGMDKGGVKLIPLIETALGVENAFNIATASKRVAALFFGLVQNDNDRALDVVLMKNGVQHGAVIAVFVRAEHTRRFLPRKRIGDGIAKRLVKIARRDGFRHFALKAEKRLGTFVV